MPSRYSSDHSIADAEELVRRQGLHSRVAPIADVVAAFEKEIELSGLAAENLQARVRGMFLMSLSNQHGHLVLTTGNKSELAAGYSTLYGDSAGGYAPIKDVPKTLVWELSAVAQHPVGPAADPGELDHQGAQRRTAPRPEATPTHCPQYEVLDRLLDDYVEKDMGRDALIAAGHDPELVLRVIRMVDFAEYKRRQYPPGPKISPKNFGRDRRLPITNKWREMPS